MKQFRLKLILIYNFVLPALLLNCVGIVILQLINVYHVSTISASWLEAFKDFSILGGSFILVSFIPKMGYKKSLMLAAVLQAAACILMATYPSFAMARLFFVMVGVGFALVKVSVYSSVGLITKSDSEHAGFLSILEGMFITGVLVGFWLFGYFLRVHRWLEVYWLLAALSGIGFVLLLGMKMDESRLDYATLFSSEEEKPKYAMWSLLKKMVVWFFLVMAFFYVFIEQGMTTWLPTYNNHVLHISTAVSVEIASILAGGIALGRIIGGVVMRRVHWRKVLIVSMIGAILTFLLSIYLSAKMPLHTAITGWSNVPLVAYLIPITGFFIGPIYPTLCSSILSRQPIRMQSAMTGLIIVASALGGTIGSRITGTFFSIFGGFTAIDIPIAPLVILLVLILPYYRQLKKPK